MCRFNKLSFVIIVLVTVSPVFTGYSWSDSNQKHSKSETTSTVETITVLSPQFDTTQTSHITVFEGQTAFLPCVVHNLSDRVVSWIRTRDLHILTSDIHQYTSDTRFEIIHDLDSDVWTLKISSTRLSDKGFYECQVNTDPKIKFPVTLTVIDSDQQHDSPYSKTRTWSGADSYHRTTTARISGPSEQYVRVGSTVTFTCEVSQMDDDKQTNGYSAKLPAGANYFATSLASSSEELSANSVRSTHAPIVWTHAGRLVTFQAARGGISLETDYTQAVLISRLTISIVTESDAGEYTCSQLNAVPATVLLKIEESERTEAMQRDMGTAENRAKSCRNLSHILFVIPFLIHFCLVQRLIT